MNTLGDVVKELSDAGADTVLVRTGEENEHLRDERMILEAIHRRGDPETKEGLLEVFEDAPEKVVWQGNRWSLHPIVREETFGETEDEYVAIYRIEDGETVFEDLFKEYRKVWFEKLKKLDKNELENDRRWKIRAREIQNTTKLSKKESQVRALDELGLEKEEIGDLIGTTEGKVESILDRIPEKFSEKLEEKKEEGEKGEEEKEEFRDYGNRYVGRRSIGEKYDVIHTYEVESESEVGEVSINVEYKKDSQTVEERNETEEVIDGKVIMGNGDGEVTKISIEEFCEKKFKSSTSDDFKNIGKIILEENKGKRYEKILEEF